jgi:Dolichyl-phosphate-mannose-protein mannosyltransferase
MPGITWDEPGYIAQGMRMVDWISRAARLQAGGEDPIWIGAHPDHPPLGKLAYGVLAAARPPSWSTVAAARAGAAVLFVILVWLTVHAARHAFDERVAWFAGGSLILTPPVLAHAQLAGLDLPMAVTWLAAAVMSLRASPGWRNAALLGILWGLALLTKFNAVLLAPPLLAWGFASGRLRWRDVPLIVATAALTFCIGWPWLWHDTLARASTYVMEK